MRISPCLARRVLLTLAIAIFAQPPAVAGEGREVDYASEIKPLLSNACYTCHGPDEATREAGFRLDDRPSATEWVITPGASDASELLARVASDDPELRMPPPGSNRPALTAEQVELLGRWIDQGAKFDEHWAYVPPRRPALPAAALPRQEPPGDAGNSSGAGGAAASLAPIDRFVRARLAKAQLSPSPPADRRTLIRRLSFDLTGLPPTAEEVEAFEVDASPDAYPRLVDRLLASQHYGERMAIHWLDLVRYADSVGIHGDQEWSMSPYRDYVIRAFNDNLPFDRFTIEQLAGDLLPNPTLEQRIASGYNRLNMITAEGGAQAKEYLAKYAADRVRTTSTVWMGATLGCAECHDHKFDPYTTKDFYRFAAFFADLEEKGVYTGSSRSGEWGANVAVPTAEQAARLAELDAEIQALQPLEAAAPESQDQLAQLQQVRQTLVDSLTTSLVSVSVAPREMRVLPRGNWMDDSGPVVLPGVPAFLATDDPTASSAAETSTAETSTAERSSSETGGSGTRQTRLDLARWMVDPQNPLVARVFVNRLWKLCFGQGLVATPGDFGAQGAVPSHPELLDWLASEFVDSGWDVKHVLRLIVLSETYRQSAQVRPELQQRDPLNKLLARQARFRLPAEMVRDNALAVSGLLMTEVGGVSARPYQPAGYWSHLNFPKREYQRDTGAGLYRRGVYTHWQRTFLHPSLAAFDAPTREECTVARTVSNTPLQALVLMNDPTYVEAARAFATKILQADLDCDRGRIEFAFEHALQRPATAEELAVLTELYHNHRRQYADDPAAAEALNAVGEYQAPEALDPVELAAWSSVARVMLNLHETINRY